MYRNWRIESIECRKAKTKVFSPANNETFKQNNKTRSVTSLRRTSARWRHLTTAREFFSLLFSNANKPNPKY